jgi:hemerythrin-like domain-containing protein
MGCCDELREDHVLIGEAERVFVAVALELSQDRTVDDDDLERLLRFADSFVGRHFAKEEKVLFPALAASGVSDRLRNRIGFLVADHASARALVETASRHRRDAAVLADSLIGWARLMQAHTAEEDDCVFPVVDQTLDPEARERVLGGFREIDERRSGGPGLGDLVDKYAAFLSLPSEVHCAIR